LSIFSHLYAEFMFMMRWRRRRMTTMMIPTATI
jgi:hypothetical protein